MKTEDSIYTCIYTSWITCWISEEKKPTQADVVCVLSFIRSITLVQGHSPNQNSFFLSEDHGT